jgi:hypothetical protein
LHSNNPHSVGKAILRLENSAPDEKNARPLFAVNPFLTLTIPSGAVTAQPFRNVRETINQNPGRQGD